MSSTKRAVSFAKDCRLLSSNFNQNSVGGNYGHQQQYHNINLNQLNYKYGSETAAATKFITQSKSNKNLNDKFQNGKIKRQQFFKKNESYCFRWLSKRSLPFAKNSVTTCLFSKRINFDNVSLKTAISENTVEFVGHGNNSEASTPTYLSRKNDLSPRNYLQPSEEKEWTSKTSFGDKNLNKSTLSLHIEAYENDAIKVQNKSIAAVAGDADEKVGCNSKKQDPFGFSRQQLKEEELMEAEMMAFKFSTKLMNVNGVKDKPMPHLYKQYIRIIAKWPKDKFKNEQRNLGYFLEQELEKVFHQNSAAPESGICERRLKALTELAESRHQHDFPNNYKSGIFGLKLKELNEINSDECRQQIGLGEPKKSFFAKLFGRN